MALEEPKSKRMQFFKRSSEYRFAQYVDPEKNIYNLAKNPRRPRMVSVNRVSFKSDVSVEEVIQQIDEVLRENIQITEEDEELVHLRQ